MMDRSQSVNRFLARRQLVNRAARFMGMPAPDDIKIEKIRKQKAKKRKRASDKYGEDQ
jgi:hypothetical protein